VGLVNPVEFQVAGERILLKVFQNKCGEAIEAMSVYPNGLSRRLLRSASCRLLLGDVSTDCIRISAQVQRSQRPSSRRAAATDLRDERTGWTARRHRHQGLPGWKWR